MTNCTVLRADAERLPLPNLSVDMVMTSPPYLDARHYENKEKHSRDIFQWIEWMLKIIKECHRVSRGPVIVVCAGVTRDRNYQPGPEGLLWEWFKLGGDCQSYRPCIFHRKSIPGSGGSDWFRSDYEYVLAFKHKGPLPWSDNKATGHPPKWALGGEMSYRLPSGTRTNQWGKIYRKDGKLTGSDKEIEAGRPAAVRNQPSHVVFRQDKDGNVKGSDERNICAIANPGNVIIEEETDLGPSLTTHKVGGGLMGSKLAHENEAPFPTSLCKAFIQSCCPPGGTVLDPMAGSGSVGQAAIELGRRAILCDIRQNQCELSLRRITEAESKLPKETADQDASPIMAPGFIMAPDFIGDDPKTMKIGTCYYPEDKKGK